MLTKWTGSYKLLVIALLCCAGIVSAADITWLGVDAGADNWNNTDNWSTGTVPVAGDVAIFDAATPEMPGLSIDYTTSTGDIWFKTAGWTINDSGTNGNLLAGNITSEGAGVNTMSKVGVSGTSTKYYWDVAADNTLIFLSGRSGGRRTVANMPAKIGDGLLLISGDFGEIFTVDEGTALVNGVLYSDNQWNPQIQLVKSGAILGGTGSISGRQSDDYFINSGGILAPGADGYRGSSIGAFTFGANTGSTVTLQTGSMLGIDLDGTANDQLVMEAANSVRLIIESGVALELAGTVQLNHDYTIVNISTGGLYTHTEDFGAVTYWDETTQQSYDLTEGVDYTITYNDDTSIILNVMNIVPEPATMGLLGFGAAAMLKRRRKQK